MARQFRLKDGRVVSYQDFQKDGHFPPCPKCRCLDTRKEYVFTATAVFHPPFGPLVPSGGYLLVKCRECGYVVCVMACADTESKASSETDCIFDAMPEEIGG